MAASKNMNRPVMVLSLLFMVIFLYTIVFAMESSDDFQLFRDLLSNLGRVSEEPITGILFVIAVFSFTISLTLFYYGLQTPMDKITLSKIGITTGLISAVLLMLMVLAPYDTLTTLHGTIVAVAGIFLIISSLFLFVSYYPSRVSYPFLGGAIALVIIGVLDRMVLMDIIEIPNVSDGIIRAVDQQLIFYVILLTFLSVIALMFFKENGTRSKIKKLWRNMPVPQKLVLLLILVMVVLFMLL